MDIFHIAIDGPVASGKGTIARALSKRLRIPCLDTGALYRSIAVHIRNAKLDANDEKAVTEALKALNMDIEIKNGTTHVKINGTDVTSKLRDNDISQIASAIAVYPEVRSFSTAKQQEIAKTKSFILEGRDISSVVLPDAKYKFYLTAKLKTRALRRQADLAAKGIEITLEEMKNQIKTRDRRDMKKGGLKQVREAFVVDNTKLTVDETVNEFILHISGFSQG
jgi:cytidylate kinase